MLRKLLIVLMVLSPVVGFTATPKKIALLFLTYDDINQSDLWQRQIVKNSHLYNVYIHQKNQPENPFFSQFIIPENVETTKQYHVRAWHALVKEAVKNPENKIFIFLTNSSVPLRPLQRMYKHLMKRKNSHIFYQAVADDSGLGISELPKEHQWKCSEWVILHRTHAEVVANDEMIIDLAARHPDDSLYYIPSLLSYHGLLKSRDVVNKETTFQKFVEDQPDDPYTFEEVTKADIKLLLKAKRKGYLFARRFSSNYPRQTIERIMQSTLNRE